jgi:ACS family tartrate transporter-like MFS transporter
MSNETIPSEAGAGIDPRAVRRKVMWRIVPLIFVLYIVSYLDRANVSFAALQMKDIPGGQFTDEVLGWGFGIFFTGYLLLEIPGALLVEHWSARKWFARILVTWGLCAMGMALVATPWQFYLARFLLGLAEAGFFPGVIVYFTHWFPRAERGRALAGMVLAVPLSLALGSWVSGQLLALRWFHLAGWQWLFLIEGLPAVLLGVAVPFLLTDRPRHARWLTPAERAWLEGTLEVERREAAAAGGATLGQALRRPTVWLLALGILATNTGGYALGFWLPTTLRDSLEVRSGRLPVRTREFARAAAAQGLASPPSAAPALPQALVALQVAKLDSTALGPRVPESEALAWLGVFYTFGLGGVWLSGRSSDWTSERKWHCVAGQVMTGVCLALAILPGLPWGWFFALLCLTGFFAYFWPPPFWVLPTLTLSASVAAVSIGFINICANVAGQIGSPVVGRMRVLGFTDAACLLLLAGCYVLGGVIISLLRVPQTPAQAGKGPAVPAGVSPLGSPSKMHS